MVTASMKRIIWAIGWYTVWTIDEIRMNYFNIQEELVVYELIMLSILIIPLLLFEDDIMRKK